MKNQEVIHKPDPAFNEEWAKIKMKANEKAREKWRRRNPGLPFVEESRPFRDSP
jgi:hypothetical protein